MYIAYFGVWPCSAQIFFISVKQDCKVLKSAMALYITLLLLISLSQTYGHGELSNIFKLPLLHMVFFKELFSTPFHGSIKLVMVLYWTQAQMPVGASILKALNIQGLM